MGDSGGVGSAFKEGTTSCSLAVHVVKTVQAQSVFIVDVEGAFLSESKEEVFSFVLTNMSTLIFPFFRFA